MCVSLKLERFGSLMFIIVMFGFLLSSSDRFLWLLVVVLMLWLFSFSIVYSVVWVFLLFLIISIRYGGMLCVEVW